MSTAAEGSRPFKQVEYGLPVGMLAQIALRPGLAVFAATQSPGQVSQVQRYAEEMMPLVLQGATQVETELHYAQERASSAQNPLQCYGPLKRNPPPIQANGQ